MQHRWAVQRRTLRVLPLLCPWITLKYCRVAKAYLSRLYTENLINFNYYATKMSIEGLSLISFSPTTRRIQNAEISRKEQMINEALGSSIVTFISSLEWTSLLKRHKIWHKQQSLDNIDNLDVWALIWGLRWSMLRSLLMIRLKSLLYIAQC